MIEIILESFSSLFKSFDIFLKTKDLTLGAILAGLAPFIVIWSKLSREREKKIRSQLIERRQMQIAFNVNEIMQALKVESKWSLQEIGSTHTVQKSSKPWLTIFMKVIQKMKLLYPRRKKKMREYLKKLGRTKLQVYIVFSIVNIYTLFATLSGHTSISTELDPYMPAINIVAQVIGNWVYTHYQGKVDVVTAQNSAPAPSDPNQFIQG